MEKATENEKKSTTRRVLRFIGNVQGVGFRYKACSVAAGFDVTGFVRNRPDRSVELVAEGSSKEIDRFLDELRDRMADHIGREEETKEPATGEFARFSIR